MQILAFDFGLKQIGVATGNAKLEIASENSVLKANDGNPNWHQVAELIAEWKPALVLIGLPLNMDGTESELSERSRKFARKLEGRFNIKYEMIDERLSSFEAKERSREEGHQGDYKKAPVDALAAKILIEQWFRQRN